MKDLARARSLIGGILFLLALALVSAAFLTDVWLTAEGGEGSKEDLDSDWWELEIEMGARESRSDLEMYDPFVPVVREHYNHTTFIYEGELEKGGQALQYSIVLVMVILPVAAILTILLYRKLIPGFMLTTLSVMCLLLLAFGSFMYLNNVNNQHVSSFIPEDEGLAVLIDQEDVDGIISNSTTGRSTYLIFISMGVLSPTAFLFFGIKREKRVRKKEVERGFFRSGLEKEMDEEDEVGIGRQRSHKGPAAVFEIVEENTEKREPEVKEEGGVRSGKLR